MATPSRIWIGPIELNDGVREQVADHERVCSCRAPSDSEFRNGDGIGESDECARDRHYPLYHTLGIIGG